MFRNSLFLKIVIIFTIPVMGILLFSSFMVYEKINIIEDLKHNELRLDYIKNSEKLIISLKQEKMISLEQLSNNNKLKILSEQQDKTKHIVNIFFATVEALSWKTKWKDQLNDINLSIKSLENFRKKVLNNEVNEEIVKDKYNEVNKKIIDMLFLIKFKHDTTSYIQELLKLESAIYDDVSIEKLKNNFNFMILSLSNEMKFFEEQITFERNLSFVFLFFCFFTLIPMFFILKNIIYNEQEYFSKIQKHKNIHELLNHTNKFLSKTMKKDDLYFDISELLSDNKDLAFNFVFDLETKKIIAQNGEYKDVVIKHEDRFKDFSQENIISKTIKRESNIVINDFKAENVSIFYNKANEFNINSMATFPIKKFDNVVGVLVLYSTKLNFFDSEVEMLFSKMVFDITNCLEKFEYEDIRLKQDYELRLSSYAFDSSSPMIITDEKNNIIKVNQAFCQILGYSKEELIGQNPRIFKTAHQDKTLVEDIWNNLKTNGTWSGDVYNKKANGDLIALRSTITSIKNDDGKVTNYLAQYMDISEQKDKEKILEYQATHDNLTGLPNRLLLTDRIERAIIKTVRHNIFGGLIFIDLDNFKEVNDTLGHDVGDILLITVAKKLKECVREEDTVSRIGGDEFIVLLDNLGNNIADARRNINFLAQKIKDALNSITHIQGHVNVSTPSIGITLFSDSSVSVQDIIKQADTAMYSAKKQGKNTIEFF